MLKQAIHKRKIKHVVHFTRICNIESILEHGIIPRSQLLEECKAFSFNDGDRHDNRTDASCLTVMHPNYKMFYPLRLENPAVDWAVIRLEPRVIWERPSLFCATNAANNSIRFLTEEQRLGVDAFEAIFAEREGFPSRKSLKLEDNEPTDVQAEVLILGVVEPEFIIDILFDKKINISDYQKVKEVAGRHKDFEYFHSAAYFYPRHDHRILKGVG